MAEGTLTRSDGPLLHADSDAPADSPTDSRRDRGSDSAPGDRPSVAVLAFENMSGDPAQEYLVDGICEDIITALSRWRWFSVTARNSSFVYKGRAVDMAQVGRELGVRYVLEGSIRAASGRIRVTAQLIEARTGAHVWADSYDRGLDDVFAVQDDITRHVVGAIEPALARSERERAARKTPEQMRAWDHILRGMWHFHQHTEAGSLEAIACFERAIALDPNSADAYAWCARPFLVLSNFRTGDAYDAAVRRGAELARKAIVIDRENALAHYALAMASAFLGEPRSAIEHAQIALSLNPNFASAHAALGMGYRAAGRYEEQLPALAEALRLSPMDTQAFSWHASIGFGLYMLGRFEEAVRSARRAIGKGWYPVCSVVLAASLGQLGDPESAAAVRELVERTGRHTAAEAVSQLANPEQRRRLAEGLVKAGMPPGAAAPVVAPLPPALAALTARERDVLRHVARGSSNAELATALGISEHTAKRHVSNILLKLELPTRSAAATLAGKAGLI